MRFRPATWLLIALTFGNAAALFLLASGAWSHQEPLPTTKVTDESFDLNERSVKGAQLTRATQSEYRVVGERTLFYPGRTPSPVEMDRAAEPSVGLIGIVLGPGLKLAAITVNDEASKRVRVNQEIDPRLPGWKLTEVSNRQIVIERLSERRTIALRKFVGTAGDAAGGPDRVSLTAQDHLTLNVNMRRARNGSASSRSEVKGSESATDVPTSMFAELRSKELHAVRERLRRQRGQDVNRATESKQHRRR